VGRELQLQMSVMKPGKKDELKGGR